MKSVTLDWKSFMSGEVMEKVSFKQKVMKVCGSGYVMYLVLIPTKVLASQNSWMKVLTTVWEICDYLCVGVIIFAGLTWMFGNRSKGIETLISGALGYLVIRHANDIKDWLKSI